MAFLAKTFLRGLAAILPVVATVYILWWFFSGAESLLTRNWPTDGGKRVFYFPGLGIAVGVLATLVVGLLLNYWLIRWLHDLGISLLEKLPLVKTIYRMLKDMVSFFAHTDDQSFNQVVMVRPVKEGPEMLGFLTRSTWNDLPEGFGGEGKVGVYLPMSYQIGGFLIVVDTDDVRPIEMEMEDALRVALAAGITPSNAGGTSRPRRR